MNASLSPILAAALAPMAPPQSIVHQIVEANRVHADLHYSNLKNSGELERRRDIAVQAQQLAYQSATGSVL